MKTSFDSSPHPRGLQIIISRCLILALTISVLAATIPSISRAARNAVITTSAVSQQPAASLVPRGQPKEPDYTTGEILVRFRPESAALKSTNQSPQPTEFSLFANGRRLPVQIERLTPVPDIVEGLRLARVAPADMTSALAAFRAAPEVVYAEPNYLRHKEAVPNDPRYSEQWALKNTGQSGGVVGADIKAEQSWDITTGSRNVVVAVIDEGIDINHNDLKDNIWRNPGEIAGNGIDDDGDGYIDDVNGWDFVHGDPSVYDGPGTNPDGSTIDAHGTHVAGTIGATGNNGLGVVGVNWQVSLMPLKFLGPHGGSSADLIQAFAYAKLMRDRFLSSGGTQGANVRVTNNSYGGAEYSQAEFDAIQQMAESGILFVAAAGNSQHDSHIVPSYPAGYDLPSIISVAATDRSDNLAYYSNRGRDAVHLGAPGDIILSTTPGNTYSNFSGTSMASPHVAGAAALVLAAHPDLSVSRLRASLLFGGDPNGSLTQTTMTGNRLSVLGALQNANDADSATPALIGDLHITSQSGRDVILGWTATGDDGLSGRSSLYEIRFSDQATGSKYFLAAGRPGNSGAQEFAEVSIPYRHTAGTLSLTVIDKAGNTTTSTTPVSVGATAAEPYSISEAAAGPLSTGGGQLPGSTFDDQFVYWGLPFNFPTFERYATAIALSTNGALYFGPNTPLAFETDHGSSVSGLASFQMIAGLWDDLDLRTSQRADAGIYQVQPDANRVIFRWQGVTCNASQVTGQCTGGAPVNFEIELQTNGTIIIRYGDGNENVHPVVGLGGAEPEPFPVASHTSKDAPLNLTNAPAVTFTLGTTPGKADLRLTTLSSPNPVSVGGSLTYEATITNFGPDSAYGVTFADTIPTPSVFAGCTTSQGSCLGAPQSKAVSASLGTIQSGASATINIVVTAKPTDSNYSNTSSVSARTFDPDQSSNSRTTSTYLYVPNPNPITGVKAIAAGGRLALTQDGSVLAWGSNDSGQLGDGTIISRTTPVWVRGLFGVKFIAAGASHSIAIKQNGTIWTWGYNNGGRLGDGTTTDRHSPVKVPGLTGMIGAAGGGGHTIAVKSDGTVWTWGINFTGELGDNTPNFRVSPAVVNGIGGATAVTAGSSHSAALRNDGTVWAWGDNAFGQLGDGSTIQRTSPTQVSGIAGIISISAGAAHTLALKNDGTVWAWGANFAGQLGDGTTANRTLPVMVNGLHDVVAIAAGPSYSFAVKTDGKIYAWGQNDSGQLGVGIDVSPLSYLTTPTPVIIISGAIAVAAGGPNVGLTANGSIFSWGGYQLAFPYQLNPPTPRPTLDAPLFSPDSGSYSTVQTVTVNLPSAPASLKSVALGGSHSLAVMSDGKVYAWGINDGGQIGLPGPFGASNYSPLPVQVNGVDSVKAAAAGDGHSLALRTDGTVWAWGRNDFGQSGTGGPTTNVPAPVLNLSNIKGISALFSHSIAVSNQGTVWVWGTGIDGTQTTQFTPVQVSSLLDVKAVAAGSNHYVALKNDGTVWTWGANGVGQLCDGTSGTRSNPAMVAGLSNVIAIGAGGFHSTFLRSDGTVWSCGDNQYGEIGDGSTTNRLVPTQAISITNVSSISAASRSTLARLSDGTVWGWGAKGGSGPFPSFSSTPSQISGVANIDSIGVGGGHFSALDASGMLWMWGANMWGQLGDGSTFDRFSPVLLTTFGAGPVIHYTTNGVDPTDEDPVISNGSSVLVDRNANLKARAFQDGFAPGLVKSGDYLINLNPIDDARNFVRNHYLDFLSREPDQGGWDYWTSQISQCGLDASCIHSQRIAVSAAFFIELEFQQTGSVVYRLNRGAYGTMSGAPTRANVTYPQFIADRAQLVGGSGLAQSTIDLANSFVQRSQFKTEYPDVMSNAEFVNHLFDQANLTGPANSTLRQAEIDALTNNGRTRAQVLLNVIEIPEFKDREYKPSFVLMQYFGYLRRDPDQGGYDFWLNILNNRLPNDQSGYRGMVCAFLTAAEYQLRFGSAITHTNQDCSN